MGAALKPYPAYRDSGLPWLGEVPEHWEVRRNGRLFAQRNETGFADLPILEVSLRTGVRVRRFDNGVRKQQMTDRSQYKRAVQGDIAYNMMRMWQGSVGIAPVDGLISPAYVVARPLLATSSRYYSYLFRTEGYMREVENVSRGIVSDRNRLYWEDFKQLPAAYPSADEQNAIAAFLDAHGHLVEALIDSKRRHIALLNEKKQALIDRTVTRGLDAEAPMKSTGIDRMPEVPAHWNVRRLRNAADMCVSNVDKHMNEGEEPIHLCNYVDVYKNDYIDTGMEFMQATATVNEVERYRLQEGDVLITKDSEAWDDIAVPALVTEAASDLVSGYHLVVLRPRTAEVSSGYLLRTLQTVSVARQFYVVATGVTRFGLSHAGIKSVWLPLPPVPEQTAVVEYLDRATAEIDAAVGRARRQIDLIREYCERLISDVVTGKLDVRGVDVETVSDIDSVEESYRVPLRQAAAEAVPTP